jgi:hypothetical protein
MPSPQLSGVYGRSQTDKTLAEAMSIKDIENYHNFIPEMMSPPALAGAPKRSPTASWVSIAPMTAEPRLRREPAGIKIARVL